MAKAADRALKAKDAGSQPTTSAVRTRSQRNQRDRGSREKSNMIKNSWSRYNVYNTENASFFVIKFFSFLITKMALA